MWPRVRLPLCLVFLVETLLAHLTNCDVAGDDLFAGHDLPSSRWHIVLSVSVSACLEVFSEDCSSAIAISVSSVSTDCRLVLDFAPVPRIFTVATCGWSA